MEEYYAGYVTCSSKEEGRKIAQAVVEKHYAACVNIIPAVESIYWWEGAMENSVEVMLIIKTKAAAIPALIKEVKSLHSYKVPEIIFFPLKEGNPDYLEWIGKEVV
ncbi:MAG: divalent-cation tolerance protein CutA [Candidatus Eremiobacteraeota bacterium]|nr:divalent-cation tolerance protein CutA [Candidatus Eremiobacteraeota bacterium]